MWNPRLLAMLWCAGMLGRWSYRSALHQLDGEFDTWAALIAFWIPLAGLVYLAGSLLTPVLRRRLRRLGR